MIGFKIIKEMSKEELVEEILQGQKVQLEEKDLTSLKAMVIEFRIMDTRERLTKEAGLTSTPGPHGLMEVREDDE